ncbi:MAG: extracellular solute-binding protein [Anaerolineaceae bacterium]|nr:extracellular solute-binding protein [Anaerolineaceae bacterium]
MLRRFWQRRRQRPFTCTDVDANVEQVRDGRLSARETAAFKAHVAACKTCRQRLKTEAAWLSALQATPAPARLTPHERRAMQQAMGQHMRRRMVMRNIRLSVQQVAVLGVLALVVGAMVWWQTAVTPAIDLENTTDSVIENQPNQQNETSVTVRFAVDDYEIAQHQELARTFEEADPNIRIQLLSVNDILDYEPATGNGLPHETALKLAHSADVFPAHYATGVNSRSILRDLAPLIQADSSFDVDDFYANVLREENGQIWVLPTSLNILVIFYNKAAFDQAGLAYPQPDWSWEDFRSTANTLTIRDNGEVTQWGFAQPFTSHLAFIESQLSESLTNATINQSNIRLNDEDVKAAVQWYTALFVEDGLAPAVPSVEAFSLIQANKVALWPDSSRSLNLYSTNSQIGIVPFPVGDSNDKSSPLFVNGFVMSAGTVHAEAAWKWMMYLSHQQALSNFGETALIPARTSIAQATDFWSKLAPEYAAALNYALAHSYPAQAGRDAYQPFNEAINGVIEGEKTVESALADAAVIASSLPAANEEEANFTVTGGDDESENNATAITFLISSNLDLEAYRILAEEFEAAHPHVQLKVQRHAISSFSSFPVAANRADCFQMRFAPVDEASRNVILNLDPFIEADPTFDLNDLYPVLVAQYTEQGQLWGVPAGVQPLVIEYNKDLFDAAGVNYPSYDWTMAEFLETAVALTHGNEETRQFGFAGDVIEFNLLPLLLERLGADLINDAVTPSTLMLDAPATIEAMRWYSNLTTEFGVKPVFVADPLDIQNGERVLERERLLNEQRIAMWTPSFYSEVGVLDPAVRDKMNIGVAPLPVGTGSGVLPASGYYISASTPYRDTCWEWIKFLSQSPSIGQDVPARRSVAESAAFSQRIGEERAAAYLASIESATDESTAFRLFVGDENWMVEAIYWLGRAYAQITAGELTVEEALNEAQITFDAYRNCMIANNGFMNVEVRNACVQEADPLLPAFLLERR